MTGAVTTRTLVTVEQGSLSQAPLATNNSPSPEIIEAQSWVRNSNGSIELVATGSNVNSNASSTNAQCPT